MARASLRPYGNRPIMPGTTKAKVIEFVTPGQGGWWPDLWGANWSNATTLAYLQQIKKLGANAVKILGGTTTESGHAYPVETTYRARRQYFFQQCRNLGLGVVWILGNGGKWLYGSDGTQGATLLPPVVALAQTIAQDAGDLLIYVDLCNEFNFNAKPTSWGSSTTAYNSQCASDMASFAAMVRAVMPGVPISASVCLKAKAQLLTNTYVDLQYALGFDIHDIHLYYQDQTYTTSGEFPLGSDGAIFEARTNFLGKYIIGEMGCASLNSGADNTAIQTQWFNGMGDILRRPLCAGVVMFCLTDFDSTYRYGMYSDTDSTFASPRVGMTVPFQSWPG